MMSTAIPMVQQCLPWHGLLFIRPASPTASVADELQAADQRAELLVQGGRGSLLPMPMARPLLGALGLPRAKAVLARVAFPGNGRAIFGFKHVQLA